MSREDPSDPATAEHQERLAEDRTVLANERTYTAWIRTGLAALAAGIGFERLLRDQVPDWISTAIAVILIGYGACAFVLAAWRYTHHGMKLGKADIRGVPVSALLALSMALTLVSVLVLAGFWLS